MRIDDAPPASPISSKRCLIWRSKPPVLVRKPSAKALSFGTRKLSYIAALVAKPSTRLKDKGSLYGGSLYTKFVLTYNGIKLSLIDWSCDRTLTSLD